MLSRKSWRRAVTVAALLTAALTGAAPAASASSTPSHLTWDGWDDTLGTPPSGLNNDSLAVSSWGPGRLDVFVLGIDGAVHHRAYDSARWSGWDSSIGAPPPGLIGGLTAASWGPGRIDLFGLGKDHGIWHRWYQSGAGWGGWDNNLGAPPTGVSIYARPNVSSWGPGRLDMFVAGTGNILHHAAYQTGVGWEPWDSFLTRPATQNGSGPAAVSWGPNRIDLVAGDQTTYHAAYQSGGWSGWYTEIGTPNGADTFCQPGVSSMGSGELDIFETDEYSHIYWREYWGGWNAWQDLGRPYSSAGCTAAASWGFDRIDLFVIGNNHRLYHKAYHPA